MKKIDMDWIKEASNKTLEEFREQQELARDGELAGWQIIPIYCQECEISFDTPLDMVRMAKIAKKRGVSFLNYQTDCIQCGELITQEVGLPDWNTYAEKGPESWWASWGHVAAGALVVAGFGVYWHSQRKRNERSDERTEELGHDYD